MNDIKFRIRMKCIKSDKGYNVGDEITLFNEPFCPLNGVAFFPIEQGMWEVLSADRFTGHIDKNKREIYESDLLEIDDDYSYALCEWDNKYAQFQINGYGKSMHHGEGSQEVYSDVVSMIDEHVLIFERDELIIIGNIHDNPELLK